MRLTSPDEMSVDWDLYRRYLQESKGEFTVAKDHPAPFEQFQHV